MSILTKIEGGYLQVLRVIVLLFATVVLIGGGIFGAIALDARLSKAPKVDSAIQVDPASFAWQSDAPAKTEAAAKDDSESPAQRLSTQLSGIVQKHGRAALSADYAVDRDAYEPSFQNVLGDEEHPDIAYYQQQIAYLDKVLSRADVAASIKKKVAGHGDEYAREQAYTDIVSAVMRDFSERYEARRTAVENEKKAAEETAAEHDQTARYAGIATLVALYSFVSLAVLIILVRVERSIRSIARTTHTAT
ncbi:hypothetical protein GQ57_10955 [Burkholderia sp. MSh2]|uniref:hypothetical protein n=1 Tax=Burkholderia TaxID=32008 RepID=UPI0004DA513C|nr:MULTISPECIES: hypothetical protein [Burkholderia]KEZ05915.1 hypothetical protein GQ57_10955 [Burkholderia sp. MSh2]KFG94210.1 hypothetical protein GQ56_0127855 [Burkholderia paludis]